jgi:tetratricopeptide (TPR) repeat protein
MNRLLGRVCCPIILVFLSGCASTRYLYLDHTPGIPDRAEVEGVPFFAQKRNHCGPASLAMVMNWGGKKVTAGALAEITITPGKEGTYQADLIGAARREGFLTFPLDSFDSLYKELAAGNPVVVFENLGFGWYPIWHYAVAIGYDLPRRTITLHSAGNSHEETRLSGFESDWSAADRWALVVLPPTKMSASGDEIAHLNAAAGLERVGLLSDAEIAYHHILGRWPHSLGALIGLGNIKFVERDFKSAANALKEATLFHSKTAAAWHNLALVYAKEKRNRAAKVAARKAIELVEPQDASIYQENLDSILSR